jgi:lipoprotein-anchoring transpeptidase ErfK/SrfK
MRVRRTAVVVTAALAVFGAGTAFLVSTSSAAVSPTTEPAEAVEASKASMASMAPSTSVESLSPLPQATDETDAHPAGTTSTDATATTAPAPVGLLEAADSVPSAGWFHVTNAVVPEGASIVRYSNVERDVQTGMVPHAPGALDLWFRALGAPGSTITIRVEALDGFGQPIAELGTIALVTGADMLPLPANSGEGRRMVVHSDEQQIWLVEADGTVSDTFPMSGRRIPTSSGFDQPGVFQVYSKSKHFRYCEDGVCGTADHMVRYQRTTRASVGTHSLPREHGQDVQTVYDLGWPISHGCSRLDPAKATEVYLWADYGTTVVVL